MRGCLVLSVTADLPAGLSTRLGAARCKVFRSTHDAKGRPMTLATSVSRTRLRWRAGEGCSAGERALAQETPVALVHDGSTTAVMMATPADLEDFALGFSLSEGIVETPAEIAGLEIVEADAGIEVRMWLAGDRSAELAARRRRMA